MTDSNVVCFKKMATRQSAEPPYVHITQTTDSYIRYINYSYIHIQTDLYELANGCIYQGLILMPESHNYDVNVCLVDC